MPALSGQHGVEVQDSLEVESADWSDIEVVVPLETEVMNRASTDGVMAHVSSNKV